MVDEHQERNIVHLYYSCWRTKKTELNQRCSSSTVCGCVYSNVTLSDQIPLERNITDYRYPACHKYTYNYDELPTLSVIIIFHNDALSMILRTVHSILMRTPEKLLSQVELSCYTRHITGHFSVTIFPTNLLTSAKHPAFSTNRLADTNKTKHIYNQKQYKKPSCRQDSWPSSITAHYLVISDCCSIASPAVFEILGPKPIGS